MIFFSSKRIPKELRELQKPWPKGPEPMVEHWARTLTRPEMHEFNGMLLASGMEGSGAGKMAKIDERLKKLLLGAAATEYFEPGQSTRECERLRRFLEKLGVGLDVLAPADVPAGAFEAALDMFRILPPHHFGHAGFRTLRMGHSPEKPVFEEGAYHRDGKLNLCDTLVLGAKRNFFAFTLHEMGHVFECVLPKGDAQELAGLWPLINPKFAVDFHFGKKARLAVQDMSPSQFIAENYMHYVSQGQALKVFIALQAPGQRARWEKLLDIYRKNFDGLQYS